MASGCITPPSKPTSSFMGFKVENQTYEGVANLDRKSENQETILEFNLPEDPLFIRIDDCATSKSHFQPKGKTFKYAFKHSFNTKGSCLLFAQAVARGGDVTTSLIDWKDNSLEAKVSCNEHSNLTQYGSFLCANKTSRLVWLEFKEPVVFKVNDECPKPVQTKNLFQIETTTGFCPYIFYSESKESFRLTIYGY